MIALPVVAAMVIVAAFLAYVLGFYNATKDAQRELAEADATAAEWKLKYEKMHAEYLSSQQYEGRQMG